MINACPRQSWRHASLGDDSVLELKEGDVHLWHATSMAAPEEYDGFFRLLSNEEALRAGRFHFEKDRAQYVVSRGILRCLLGRYLGVSPSELEFSYTEFGKPFVERTKYGRSVPCFNVAHSGSRILIGVSREGGIGIDVEEQRLSENRMLPLRDRICTAEEKHWIDRIEPNQKEAALTRLWTAKESYLKAIGTGFQIPPDEVQVTQHLLEGSCQPGAVTQLSEGGARFGPHSIFPVPSCEEVLSSSAAVSLPNTEDPPNWKWMASPS